MVSARLAAVSAIAAVAAACTNPTPPPTPPPAVAAAEQQLPPGRVYSFHSTAQAGCPALDWHVVLEENGALAGMISWDNMASLARASGRVNTQTNTFQMTAREVGGRGRTATIDGTVNPSTGWLTANIRGANVTCLGINVPWFRPYTGR